MAKRCRPPNVAAFSPRRPSLAADHGYDVRLHPGGSRRLARGIGLGRARGWSGGVREAVRVRGTVNGNGERGTGNGERGTGSWELGAGGGGEEDGPLNQAAPFNPESIVQLHLGRHQNPTTNQTGNAPPLLLL